MRRIYLLAMGLAMAAGSFAAQTLNNPIGSDGCYIVKWDCTTNSFASSNDFEVDETFTFAIDITGTQWVSWLAADNSRRIATNFGLNGTGNGIARDGDRLFHIQGNIWGKTINIQQLATTGVNLTPGSQQSVYSNLFGFDMNGAWWQNPGDDIVGNSDCFFHTAAYTGTKTGAAFTTSQYANDYSWIDQAGYASPCANPGMAQGGSTGNTDPDPEDPPVVPDQPADGSQVYTFPTDAQMRGWYNRPYERYEAEPGRCTTNGQFLAATDNQQHLQSEASHQQALQLINQGDYVSWVVNRPGDGLTVRFSLPDNANGTGTDGNLDIYAGTDKVGTIYLNSYWAWQYCDGTYPDNTPRTGNVVIRMRFDENHVRLSRSLQQGEVLKLVKKENNSTPYTIDFAELEPVPARVEFSSLSGNKVQFDGNGDVADFIMNNQGKTIYIPEGTWNSSKRIYLTSADNTKLIGAGMWYTQIYFTASSDQYNTHSYRGIEASSNNLLVEGLYLNTVNNKRYYQNNAANQVGKGFMGGWGNNSTIRNCWVEHFECGAWIADYTSKGSNNLTVEYCRFRNNYADGLNCSNGSHGHTIRYCSFRNNGDDDMASWTTYNGCSNISFSYCTAENNWRASSLGFFGGNGNSAHHLYLADGLESGLRVNSDFDGNGFTGNAFEIHDITIDHCGCLAGTKGTGGDFWGASQGALNLGSTSKYEINNIHFRNIDILRPRWNAVYVRAQSGKNLNGCSLRNITISDAPYYGIFFSGARGTMSYCHLTFNNVTNHMNAVPSTLTWTEDCSGETSTLTPNEEEEFPLDGEVIAYDIMGRCCYHGLYTNLSLPAGIYILHAGNRSMKVCVAQ